MKRSLIAVFVVALVALPAWSFDPVKRSRGAKRITVLQPPDGRGDREGRVASRICRQLVDELRRLGFDAVDGRVSFDDLLRERRTDGGFYAEITPEGGYSRTVGGVGVNVPNATVDIGVIVSRVAAELRVYDGRTLDLIAKRALHSSSTTVVPTGVGVGTYRMSIWFALPFVEYARYRNAVNDVVRDAAREIAGIAR